MGMNGIQIIAEVRWDAISMGPSGNAFAAARSERSCVDAPPGWLISAAPSAAIG